MKKGLFVGLAGLDFVYYLDQPPVENKKYKTNDYSCAVGGPAANAAITYTLLGGTARLITCIGDSDFGKVIKKTLTEEYGIELIDLAASSELIPSVSSILVNPANGNRTVWSGQQVWNGAAASIAFLAGLLDSAAFCLSDCQLYDVSRTLLACAQENGIPVILDAGSWKDYIEEYFAIASDIIASGDCISPEGKNLLDLRDLYPAKNLAVTQGEGDILWKDQEGSGSITPPTVVAVDTLGAGDVFHGAYCYFKFERGLTFAEALEQAAQVAASSVQYRGVAQGIRAYQRPI